MLGTLDLLQSATGTRDSPCDLLSEDPVLNINSGQVTRALPCKLLELCSDGTGDVTKPLMIQVLFPTRFSFSITSSIHYCCGSLPVAQMLSADAKTQRTILRRCSFSNEPDVQSLDCWV